jgi:hypothetical protein
VTERTGRALVWAILYVAAMVAPHSEPTDLLLFDLIAASCRTVFAVGALCAVALNLYPHKET